MARPKLVVFDMAGTTVEDLDVVNLAIQRALSEFGVAASHEEINPLMGIAKPIAIRTLLEQAGEQADDKRAMEIHERFRENMLHEYRTGDVRPIPGIPELLADLRTAGIKVALDTGFSRDIANVILDRVGWSVPETLDASVTSDEVSAGRPYPDMIFEAMARTGVEDVREVAKVGDTPNDTAQGLAAGCGWVIAVTYGTHRAGQLAGPGILLVDHVDELRQWLL